MSNVDAFLNTLFHAESRYDPQKAHEYYLRTRELKGRRSGSDLKSDKQKEGWAYTKSEVDAEKKRALDEAAEGSKKAIAELRAKVEERREVIREQLRTMMERLSGKTQSDREALSKKVQDKIAALPPIPRGLSKEAAAKKAEERRKEIAKIRGDAAVERKALGETATSERAKQREAVNRERKQVVTELKVSLDKARETYETAKKEIVDRYEAELDNEFEAIKTNVR